MKINEQIRALRRERKMTQEQLAEAVGVSAAAVSKWESGLSMPEIGMMIALADHFEVSLDALVGYQMPSRRRVDMAEDIRRMKVAKQYEEAQPVAEEALRRYPHDFAIVRRCAEMYCARGMELNQARDLKAGLELLDRLLSLWEQNKDPKLRREEILHLKGMCCACLGWHDQAIRWFEQSNVMGVSDGRIASSMVELGKYDRALPMLSAQMIKAITNVFNSVFDEAVCLLNLDRAGEAAELIAWGLDVIRGLEATKGSYVFKMRALLCALAAIAALDQGKEEAAQDFMGRALRWARRYDEQPDPTVNSVRFCDQAAEDTFCDNIGETARAGVERVIRGVKNEPYMPQLMAMFREMAQI